VPQAPTPPAVRDRAAWTYVSGLVSALEGRLLTRRATLDLLNAGGLDALLTRVRQSLLFTDLPETTEPFALAESMQAAFATTVRRLGADSPTPLLADLFLLPIEWQAFRGVLREKALSMPRTPAPGAAISDDIWERCWTTIDVEPPHDLFALAAAAIREAMPREKHDQRLVHGITHVYEARHIRRTAQALGNPSVLGWTETSLKLTLALALLRCRVNDWGHVRGADALDDLGVSKQDIMTLVGPERPNWQAPLSALGLSAVATLPEAPPQAALGIERLIDDQITELAHDGRGVPFGPELVFAFLWGLRAEALNLRLIVTGVAAGLPDDAIANDIRQTYV